MTKIDENTDLKIIEFLNKNGPSFLGELTKDLKLSNSKGLKHTNKLISQGKIKLSSSRLKLEINAESK